MAQRILLVGYQPKTEAKAEAHSFIDETLTEYVMRTPRVDVAPAWAWSLTFPPAFIPRANLILLPEHLIVPGWVVDKDLTKRALRYTIAHEFAHYKQYYLCTRQPWNPILHMKLGSQIFADAEAFRLTGITSKQDFKMWGELIEKILKGFGV